METLSICMVSGDFFPAQIGGQGIYAHKICEGLSNLGHEVHALVPPNPERLTYYKERRHFNVVFARGLAGEATISFSLQAYRNFKKKLANYHFDILHGNELFSFFFLLQKPRNVNKTISISHNSYLERFYASTGLKKIVYPLLICLEKLAYSGADRVIVGSEMEHEVIRSYGIDPSKISLVYYGVDLDKFKPSKKPGRIRSKLGIDLNEVVVLFVGRMVERKKPHILVEAMNRVARTNPNVHCVLVGDGKFRREAERRVAVNMSDRIHFVGSVSYDELPDYYVDSDMFVLPSVAEGGISLVVLEAAATGLPLILTKDASSWSPVLQENKNGYIVKPSDPIDLGEKILLTLENMERMGKESRAIVEEYFSWDACVKGTLDVYKNALETFF